MEQILKYIDNNIDTLYKYGMDKKGLYKSISKGKSATEIRVVNYKEKMKFAENLIQEAEKMIKKNHCKARFNSISHIRS